jgi:hypothetical protein
MAPPPHDREPIYDEAAFALDEEDREEDRETRQMFAGFGAKHGE